MKRALIAVAVLAALACTSSAQTAVFTWNGDDSSYVEMATIDNQPVNQANGYGGAIGMNGNPLITLPQSLGFPNNGYIDYCTPVVYGAKTWGTRSDGTTMDGTRAGDAYTIPASTTCGPFEYAYDPPAYESVQVDTIENITYVQVTSCGRTGCKKFLVPRMQGGSGTASVVQ